MAARDRPFAGIPGGVAYTEPKKQAITMEDLLYSISDQAQIFMQQEATSQVSIMCCTCETPKSLFLGVKHEVYVCEEDYEFFVGVLKGQHPYKRYKHCQVLVSYVEDEIEYQMETQIAPDFWHTDGRGMSEEELYDAGMPRMVE